MSNKTNKLGPALGDLVEFDQANGITFKLQQQPIDVMKVIEDKNNPRFNYHDSEDVPPEDDGRWIVIDQRDLFNNFGRRQRIVKIANLLTNSSGWVHGKSLKTVAEVDE